MYQKTRLLHFENQLSLVSKIYKNAQKIMGLFETSTFQTILYNLAGCGNILNKLITKFEDRFLIF